MFVTSDLLPSVSGKAQDNVKSLLVDRELPG